MTLEADSTSSTGTWLTTLPAPDEEIVPGVFWGSPACLWTPAFWKSVVHHAGETLPQFGGQEKPLSHTVAFCLLGGYGVTFELNEAAFCRILDAGLLEPGLKAEADAFEQCLSEPLRVNGRSIRYRFPRQRGKRLAAALAALDADPPPADDVFAFRRNLMRIPGIGPKTASWIARDWLGSDQVAILDIHLIRACQIMKLFPRGVKLPRDYDRLERRFLDFASALGVRASVLDSIIWMEMREAPRLSRVLR